MFVWLQSAKPANFFLSVITAMVDIVVSVVASSLHLRPGPVFDPSISAPEFGCTFAWLRSCSSWWAHAVASQGQRVTAASRNPWTTAGPKSRFDQLACCSFPKDTISAVLEKLSASSPKPWGPLQAQQRQLPPPHVQHPRRPHDEVVCARESIPQCLLHVCL